jgi:hypothetical protein
VITHGGKQISLPSHVRGTSAGVAGQWCRCDVDDRRRLERPSNRVRLGSCRCVGEGMMQ